MRYLGIDYGEKRIGIAISDPLRLTAQPLSFIPNSGNVIDQFKKVLLDYEVEGFVLGLPKNREGGDSLKCQEVREFGEKLTTALGIKLIYWDERFSTVAVSRHLIAADVSRKKRKNIIDSQAAMFILQGYLDSLNRQSPKGDSNGL